MPFSLISRGVALTAAALLTLGLTSAPVVMAQSGPGAAVLHATQVLTGGGNICALTRSGSALCWGSNIVGQLGNGTTTGSLVPVQVAGLTSGIASISVGGGSTCAVTTSGSALCWGFNHRGQLGNGTTTNSSAPVQVAGLTSGVASISAGGINTCALTTSGTAKCWGDNLSGELGNGTTTNSRVPVQVAGLASGVASISVGGFSACALTRSGSALCWGSNDNGQLGNGTTTNSSVPVQVAGLAADVASISAGEFSACALTTGGAVKCWGRNDHGQLGNGATTNSRVPVQVVGLTSGVASISVGVDTACALTTGGAVKCWGRNGSGQLGNGTTTDSRVPVQVAGLTSGVVSISVGAFRTCALTTGGAVKCWGLHVSANPGDGTAVSRTVPTNVLPD